MDFFVKRIIKTFFTVLITAAILLGLIFAFIKGWQWLSERKDAEPEPETTTEQQTDQDQPLSDQPDGKGDRIAVEVIPAIIPDQNEPTSQPTTSIAETLTKTGLIIADQNVEVYPEATAILTNLTVKEGDEVKQGQLIAEIGDSTQLELAKANYQHALESLQLAEQSLQLTQQSNRLTQSTFNNQVQAAQLSIQQAVAQLESSQLVRYQQDALSQAQAEAETDQPTTDQQQPDQSDPNSTEPTENQANEGNQADQEPILYPSATDQDQDQSTDNDENDFDKVEFYQNNLERTQAISQDLQSHFQIRSARNQLNQLLKQLQSTKAQQQLQELNAITQINQIRQQLQTAQINLSVGKITSPISGVISTANLKPGQRVNPNSPLLTITNFDSIIITANLTPQELFQIDQDQDPTLNIFDQKIAGKILSTSPIADPQTKTITVKIGLNIDENTNLPLIPNTFAEVSFPLPQDPIATNTENQPLGFVVPLNVLRFVDQQISIPLVKNDQVKYQPVKLGQVRNGHAPIISGINNDDLIIISPRLLAENTPVRPAN